MGRLRSRRRVSEKLRAKKKVSGICGQNAHEINSCRTTNKAGRAGAGKRGARKGEEENKMSGIKRSDIYKEDVIVFTPCTMSLIDMALTQQIEEARRMAIADIQKVFAIPPTMKIKIARGYKWPDPQ